MSAYARVATARSSSGWTVSGNTATLFADAVFPTMAGGAGGTVTYFGVGLGSSGSTELDHFGAVTPNLVVVAGIEPKLDTTTNVTQASPDSMTNTAATKYLLHYFNNASWSSVGDNPGLQPSSTAGSLYISLHTSSPAESGNQSTNEISYS